MGGPGIACVGGEDGVRVARGDEGVGLGVAEERGHPALARRGHGVDLPKAEPGAARHATLEQAQHRPRQRRQQPRHLRARDLPNQVGQRGERRI